MPSPSSPSVIPQNIRLGIIGLGQMGCSFGMALKQYTPLPANITNIIGYDPDPITAKSALEIGAIDSVADNPNQIIESSDALMLACSMGASIEWLGIIGLHQKRKIIMDLGSAKAAIWDEAMAKAAHHAIIPTHPIAGTAQTGPKHASHEIYRHRKCYITSPHATDGEINIAQTCWEAVGARVEYMDAPSHDAIFAAASHYPHWLGFSYAHYLGRTMGNIGKIRGIDNSLMQFTRTMQASPTTWLDTAYFNLTSIKQSHARLLDSWDEWQNHMEKPRDSLAYLGRIHDWRQKARRLIRPETWQPHALHDPYIQPSIRAVPPILAYFIIASAMKAEAELKQSLYPHLGEGFYSITLPACTQPHMVAELWINTPAPQMMADILQNLSDWINHLATHNRHAHPLLLAHQTYMPHLKMLEKMVQESPA